LADLNAEIEPESKEDINSKEEQCFPLPMEMQLKAP
jgi:hypothetical protein